MSTLPDDFGPTGPTLLDGLDEATDPNLSSWDPTGEIKRLEAEPKRSSNRNILAELIQEAIDMNQVVPMNFLRLRRLLKESPELFDIAKAEREIREVPEIQEAMAEEGSSLYKGVLKLRLPFIEDRQAFIQSEAFREIWPLLAVYERFIKTRVNGLSYLLNLASQHYYYDQEQGRRVSTEPQKFNGSVIRIDLARFSERTHKDGAEETSGYLETNFYPTLFEVLRVFPNVKFLKTIGDEVICVSEDDGTAEHIQCAQSLKDAFAKKDIPVHIGVSNSEYTVQVTKIGGHIVVSGSAYDEAGLAQKESKKAAGGVSDNIFIYAGQDQDTLAEGPIDYTSSRPIPKRSALEIFQLIPGEVMREFLAHSDSDPVMQGEILKEEMLRVLALAACTITEQALRLEHPKERRATCLCIKAPANPDESIDAWEASLEDIARKYNGKVVHPEMSNEEKMGIIAFGAGTSQIMQEERAALCANDLCTRHQDATVGIECGEIYLSDTSRTPELSDALNEAVRLTYAGQSSVIDPTGTERLGRIRLGPQATSKFTRAKITVETGDNSAVDFRLKGFESPQRTVTCDGFKTRTPNTAHAGKGDVENIVSMAEDALKRMKQGNDGDTRIHINGPSGIGLTETMTAVATEYRSISPNIVLLSQYRLKYKSYSGICEIVDGIFQSTEDFNAWAKQNAANERQTETWTTLYEELNGTRPPAILISTDRATTEINAILGKFQDLAIVCPNFDQMDEVSRDILLKAPVLLITTGQAENGTIEHTLEGLDLDEALVVVARRLKVDEIQPGHQLARHITEHAPKTAAGKYIPGIVEAMIDQLIATGALTSGAVNFDSSKAPSADRETDVEELLDDLVTDRIDRVSGNIHAMHLLKVALACGDCERGSLIAAVPEAEDHLGTLQEHHIVEAQNGSVRFCQGFFAKQARKRRELELDGGEKKQLEQNLRAAPMPTYLRVCGNIGLALNQPVVDFVCENIEQSIRAGNLLAAVDTCSQFTTISHGETAEAINANTLEEDLLTKVLSTHFALIETKCTIGRNAEADIEGIEALIDTMHESDFKHRMKGQLLNLKCLSAFRTSAKDLLAARTTELETHYQGAEAGREETAIIGLRKAQLLYDKAGDQSQDKQLRIQQAEEGLRLLAEIETASISKPLARDIGLFALRLRGYKVIALEGPTAETVDHLAAELTTKMDTGDVESEEALAITPYLAQGLAMTGRIRGATEITEKNIEVATRNGFTKALANNLNFLMNIKHQEGLGQIGKITGIKIALRFIEAWLEGNTSTAAAKAGNNSQMQAAIGNLTELTRETPLEEDSANLINAIYSEDTTATHIRQFKEHIAEYSRAQPSETETNQAAIAALGKHEEPYQAVEDMARSLTKADTKVIARAIIASQITRLECITDQLEVIYQNGGIDHSEPEVLVMRGYEMLEHLNRFYTEYETECFVWNEYMQTEKLRFTSLARAMEQKHRA